MRKTYSALGRVTPLLLVLSLAVGTPALAQVGGFARGGKPDDGGGGKPGKTSIDHRGKQSTPIKMGTSGGNINDEVNGICASGTLGALLTDGVNSTGRCNMSQGWRFHGAKSSPARDGGAKDGTVAPVATKRAQQWSPQQIAGWLRQAYPEDPTMHVSHETIYLSLFVQSRGVRKKALQAQWRQRRTIRRPRAAAPKTGGYIVGAVSIRERPAAVEDRAVPGHWEGDLLVGARQSYVATLVERRSRDVCLVRVSGRATRTVVHALTRHVTRLPAGLMATLTWDRGLELAAHRSFSIATGVQVYFCDPYSPWQRGTNENTNGLLRQYLPKGTDLARYTQAQLNKIARALNTRPRKTLGYRTPADILADTVALTG